MIENEPGSDPRQCTIYAKHALYDICQLYIVQYMLSVQYTINVKCILYDICQVYII